MTDHLKKAVDAALGKPKDEEESRNKITGIIPTPVDKSIYHHSPVSPGVNRPPFPSLAVAREWFAAHTHDLLAIPPWMDRRGEKPVLSGIKVSREIIMPKGLSDRKKRQIKNKLKHLGYPDHMIRGCDPQWAYKAIESRIKYVDPMAVVKEEDAVMDKVIKTQKKEK